MRRPPPALRHVITHRVAFAAVVLTALITAAFTAAAISFVAAVTAAAPRSELGGKPAAAVVVTASTGRAGLQRASADVAELVHGPAGAGGQPELPASIRVSIQSAIMDLPRGSGPKRQTQLISMPALAGHVRMISGTCPGAGSGGGGGGGGAAAVVAVPACVPQAAARAFGLTAGQRVSVRDSISGKLVQVRITGIFAPVRASGPYWLMSPQNPRTVRRSRQFTVAGPMITSRAIALRGAFRIYSATWLGVPVLSRLDGSALAAIASQLSYRIQTLPSTGPLADASVTTALPGRLTELATALVVTRTQMLAGLVTLLVVAGATLSLAVRLLAQQREAEAALLAARGASRAQLARRGLLDAGLVAGLAALAGPLFGAALAPLLIRSSYTATSRLALAQVTPGALPAAVTWLVTAAVAAGCVAIIALPWLRRPPSPLRRRASRGRQRSVAAAVYARADLVIMVIAAGAVWQLTRSPGPVSAGLDGTLSADPILVVAPVLALVAGALLTLRVLPLAARVGDGLAARGAGLAMPFAAWQISRRTLRQAGPTLVAVLAVAVAVMALAQRDSWRQSVRAQASFIVGADARVTMPSAAPLPLGEVAHLTGAPGVTASTPAVRSAITLPNGNLATLIGLDASVAARIIPPEAAGPAPKILRQLAAAGPKVGVRIPGRPAAVQLTARLTRAAIAQSLLLLQVTDAAGIGYQVVAGSLPADGRPHLLTAPVAAGGHADYPLRITGFSLQFATPGKRRPNATLTVSSGVALAAGGFQRSPFPLTASGAHLLFAASQNPGSIFPAAVRFGASGGGITATFKPGFASADGRPGPGAITITDGYPGFGAPLPAVATRSFLTATSLRVGDRAQVNTDGVTVPVMVLGVVKNLPTLTDGSPGLLVDQRALTDELLATGAQPVPITQWWLRTSGHLVLAGLPPDTTTALQTAVARALGADPLSVAGQQGLLGIAIAAALLAIIGLLVSVATAGERSRDAALLDALGMPPGSVARLLSIEQALTAAATSVIGLLFGVALSELIIPAVTLTIKATRPVPAIIVQVPWLPAAAIALAMAAVPTVAVVLTLPRSASAAARIRLEDEI